MKDRCGIRIVLGDIEPFARLYCTVNALALAQAVPGRLHIVVRLDALDPRLAQKTAVLQGACHGARLTVWHDVVAVPCVFEPENLRRPKVNFEADMAPNDIR